MIPVTSGMMRNIWYPKKMAEYLTLTKLRELGVKKDSTVERDSAFRSNAERKLEKLQEKEKAEEVPEIVQRPAFEEASEPAPHVELEFFSVRYPFAMKYLEMHTNSIAARASYIYP